MMRVLKALIGQPQDESVTYFEKTEDGCVATTFHIEPECQIDLLSVLKAAQPDFVLRSFEHLLDPADPEHALGVATNPILGKYRRLVCGKFRSIEDGKYASQAQKVMDMLSASVVRLNAAERAIMKKWIDESHDESGAIYKFVSDALPNCRTVLVLRADPGINVDDLLALGRGGGN